jgi:hypothetical protein
MPVNFAAGGRGEFDQAVQFRAGLGRQGSRRPTRCTSCGIVTAESLLRFQQEDIAFADGQADQAALQRRRQFAAAHLQAWPGWNRRC